MATRKDETVGLEAVGGRRLSSLPALDPHGTCGSGGSGFVSHACGMPPRITQPVHLGHVVCECKEETIP